MVLLQNNNTIYSAEKHDKIKLFNIREVRLMN